MLPREAWEKASWEVIPQGGASREKNCPKTAFLALHDESINTPNAIYARAARKYLRLHQNINITPSELWQRVLGSEKKAHNGQMDFVLALKQNEQKL